MYIDCHCHVYGEKLDALLQRARSNNVRLILNSGANVRANRETLKLSQRFPEFLSSMGLYPLDALKMSDEKIDKELDFIAENKDNISAISEVGMDYKETEDRKRQEQIFRKFISLSIKLNKPIVVHSRKAELRCIEVLEEMKAKKVIMHCFSGKLKLVERIAQNGWFITIPTSVKRSEHFQKVISLVPIEQLFCETDSPYLHPDGQEAKEENEPANVVVSYEKIAEIKGLPLKKVEKHIEDNFRKLFEI